MSASAVRGGQVYVEIGGNPSKLLSALSTVNTKVADVGATMESVGMGMAAVGAAIAGPILAVGGAFVENTIEMQNMRAALADIGRAVAEAVAPAFIGAANIITGASKAVAKFIRENQGLVRLAVLVGGYYFAWGTAIWAVGYAMTSLSKTMSSSAALISGFIANIKGATVAVVAFATSGPVLAVAAVLAGLAGGAVLAGVNFRKLAGIIGGAFGQPIANLKTLFNDLKGTADTTVEGIYRAIAAGDLRAAVDVLWLGWYAAWVRGEKAIMDSLDPFIEDVQNAMSFLGVAVAAQWERTFADLATSEWGSAFLASLDNVINLGMASWDEYVGFLQKEWAYAMRFIGRMSKDELGAELDRIKEANAANAAQRGRDNPGFAGRTNLTEEQKAAIRKESEDRQAAMFAGLDQQRKERADRTKQNLADRAAAVAAANKNLLDRVNGLPEVKRFEGGGGFNRRTESIGTFSAFGLGQLGTGNIDKQTLDEIKRTNKLLEKLVAGGVVP
jgi:hypothetical protein